MVSQSVQIRPATERDHPGRTALIVGACGAVLVGALFAGAFALSRVVELLSWFAGS